MFFCKKNTQFCGLGSILERIGGAARDHTALNRTQNGLSNSKKSPANPGHIVDGGGKAFPESAKFDRILQDFAFSRIRKWSRNGRPSDGCRDFSV